MPRQARETGEFLHIIVRGNGKQILFEDDSDKVKYLSFIEKFADETEIVILAYCLMENHVHLLLRDSQAKISVFMKKQVSAMHSTTTANTSAQGIYFRTDIKAN